ncbi:MAG: gephyrin-like molybdotransferase Glp [Pirellulales bacterium]
MSATPSSHSNRDVRMRGFASRATVDQAFAWLNPCCDPLADESVGLADAGGRVLAETIASQIDVPDFRRAMMDGFALQAEDTSGASSYNRRSLAVVGQSFPAQPYQGVVQAGQAVRIMTGAPLPDGANAVLPAEQVETEEDRIYALGEVPPQKNVGHVGEDIRQGTKLFGPGRCLRPQDLGVLSSIGVGQVAVVRQPRVRIVVTGNEVLPAGSKPHDYQIADANGPMLTALVQRDGGLPFDKGIVPDKPDSITEALRSSADVVLVSGGSSVGQEDHVPTLLADHGELAIHGIAMRPSSPTGMGRMDGRLVFLLPGNPVSCLCAYDFFAGRAIRALGGRPRDWPYRLRTGKLRRKLVSVIGRVDYARVSFVGDDVEPIAISGASVLSSTTAADGFAIIPADSEGYPEGQTVDVYLYDA